MARGRDVRALRGLFFVMATAATLAGCGRAPTEQRAAWRDQAESACLRSGAVKANAYLERRPEIENGVCGMRQPFRVTAFADGAVTLRSYATLACPMIPAVERWLADEVQPAAERVYGQKVAQMRQIGSYACRRMNNGTGTRMRSEHAFGNALDIAAFTLEDGREITLKTGWRGDLADREFLRSVFVGACRHFSTVLGPGSDGFHEDHFHLDLARHRSGRTICKPVIKFTPGEGFSTPAAPPLSRRTLVPRPVDAEEDDLPPEGVAPDEGQEAPGEIPEAKAPPPPSAPKTRVAAAPASAPPATKRYDEPLPRSAAAPTPGPAPRPASGGSAKGDRLDRIPQSAQALAAPPIAQQTLSAPRPAPAAPPGWNVGPQPLARPTPPRDVGTGTGLY